MAGRFAGGADPAVVKAYPTGNFSDRSVYIRNLPASSGEHESSHKTLAAATDADERMQR